MQNSTRSLLEASRTDSTHRSRNTSTIAAHGRSMTGQAAITSDMFGAHTLVSTDMSGAHTCSRIS
ncbi:hypothetical protein GIB67_035069 [Kingdonia uniflora]|uniref:Uncharacterized protein n=1 Tax=Kingdonia uniflora TaxID=39325 RepID=A0A7J7L1J4_9MAGN|nr:hypothetical protein GIB67_035069 [Kingdonia uniflora]